MSRRDDPGRVRKRQPRNRRRPGSSVVLTERDQALLTALTRFRIARTSDLVRLLFAEARRDTASHRLRRLFDGGYLEAIVGNRAVENVYRLGPAGRRWAAAQGLRLVSPPRSALDHHLAVVRAWVDLARVCHELSGGRLLRVLPEWELRLLPETAAYRVVPDALMEMSLPGPENGAQLLRMALEVDLGTEGERVLRAKVRSYCRLVSFGEGLWGWTDVVLGFAVSGWTEERRVKFAEFLEASWPGLWLIWDLEKGSASALVEVLGGREAPLTNPPYCKGGESSLTP